MNCPKCNAELSLNESRCLRCGQSLDVYHKIVKYSYAYYNVGLEQAKVRDLSGAVRSLKKSLKLYKFNTDARNLLALAYYEMGEVVVALNEWVVSNHLQPEGNAATAYIDQVQSNPSKLEAISQTIRKYNAALTYAKQGNEDLAILQLKKVTSLNPKFIRATQLLSLLYMHAGDRGKAMRCLMQAKKVDVNNTLTLKYMEELHGAKGEAAAANDGNRMPKVFRGEPVSSIMPVDSYKEEKPRVLPFLNVLLGFALGVLVMVFLVQLKPSNEKEMEKRYSEKITEYGEQLAAKDSTISSLENELKNLREQVDAETSEEEGGEATPAPNAAAQMASYDALLKSAVFYMEGKKVEAARTLLGVDEAALASAGEEAKKTYKDIKKATFKEASATIGEEGRVTYNSGNYEEALPLLEEALALDGKNVNAMYFMGRLHQRQNEKEKAAQYYNQILEKFPDSARVSEATARLRELGM